MRHELPVGTSAELIHLVTGHDSAIQLRMGSGDDFPDVLATSRMIGLMELTAARLMRPVLHHGELSVGVRVDVVHLAATPLYEKIRIQATFLGLEGKLYRFQVELFDQGGKVGEGTHLRAVVRPDRLVESAQRRIAAGQPDTTESARDGS
ncbi:MAG: thioesterase [Magnetococcales bacterium]|nr:thioesterase [Magnetococcales bacterium]NGZ06620.1 thioesterase [Magnetococcales bacterium]